jgi:hypothetical protein
MDSLLRQWNKTYFDTPFVPKKPPNIQPGRRLGFLSP